jgi:alcohol dehydrogenase, propanol-preferring
MGFRIAAIARGADKRELAMKLGAHIYIDRLEQNAAVALTKAGRRLFSDPVAN